MNFTCIDPVVKCNANGVTRVFDRSYNNSAYDISFFRCNDHPCGISGTPYTVNTIEWTCYNATVPKDCTNSLIPLQATTISTLATDYSLQPYEAALLDMFAICSQVNESVLYDDY
jgi:hypothetical protein